MLSEETPLSYFVALTGLTWRQLTYRLIEFIPTIEDATLLDIHRIILQSPSGITPLELMETLNLSEAIISSALLVLKAYNVIVSADDYKYFALNRNSSEDCYRQWYPENFIIKTSDG